MKTAEVRSLILEVLETIPEPYSHHIIDEVFAAIEHNPEWRRQYDSLCTTLGRDVVNNWGGRWVAALLGKQGEKQVPSKKSSLIGSYSLLDAQARIKLKEADARKLMSDYYQAHRDELPSDVSSHRELILALLLDGLTPQEAFALALGKDT